MLSCASLDRCLPVARTADRLPSDSCSRSLRVTLGTELSALKWVALISAEGSAPQRSVERQEFGDRVHSRWRICIVAVDSDSGRDGF
jgi:hypothetical protein